MKQAGKAKEERAGEDIHIVETTCEECPIGKGGWCSSCDAFPYKEEE